MDHQGHGQSHGTRGYVENFEHFVNDAERFVGRVKEETSSLKEAPFFLVGHSMGANISVQLAQRDPKLFSGVFLSAPLVKMDPQKATPFLTALAFLLSNIIPKYRFPGVAMKHEDICRSAEVVEEYKKDPLVYNDTVRVRMGYNLICACSRVQEICSLVKFPIAVAVGSEDRVCMPQAMIDFYQNAPSKQKKLFLYEGLFHELFLEPESEQVLDDMISFFEQLNSSKKEQQDN